MQYMLLYPEPALPSLFESIWFGTLNPRSHLKIYTIFADRFNQKVSVRSQDKRAIVSSYSHQENIGILHYSGVHYYLA